MKKGLGRKNLAIQRTKKKNLRKQTMQLQMGYVSEWRLLKRRKASEHLKQYSRPLVIREISRQNYLGILSPLIRTAAIEKSRDNKRW